MKLQFNGNGYLKLKIWLFSIVIKLNAEWQRFINDQLYD